MKKKFKERLIEKVNEIWKAGYNKDINKSAQEDVEDILEIVEEELLELFK